MSKKSLIERQKKRKILFKYFSKKKNIILESIKNNKNVEEHFKLNQKIQKLPKNSFRTRIKNSCWKTGKSRGYFQLFGLCRNVIREFAHNCYLPGLTKASW